jgi:hypothetical protein
MPVTLVLAGLRVPADAAPAIVPSVQAPVLRRALARAKRGALSHDKGSAYRAWLARMVFVRAPGGTAPYAYAALTGRPPTADAAIWSADPVHLELARDHLVALPMTAPTADEADALLAAANAIVDSAGARFERAGDRWFLITPADWQLETVPLEAAWRSALQDVLPAGRDAQQWSRLLNEIQMAWHQHPVNEAREARGEATINSVWLHGGGAWAKLPPLPFSVVSSDVPELRGAADAAGVPTIDGEASWPDGALVVWTDALAARALHDWSTWREAVQTIDARLDDRPSTASTDIVLTGLRSTLVLHCRPSDRLKFWRARPLDEVLTE